MVSNTMSFVFLPCPNAANQCSLLVFFIAVSGLFRFASGFFRFASGLFRFASGHFAWRAAKTRILMHIAMHVILSVHAF
jgi:hypothetical protein